MFQKKSYTRDGEWSAQEGEQCFLQDMEERLGAYYGPALPEYRLSTTAWLRVRDQLKTPAHAPRQHRPIRDRLPPGFRQRPVPGEIQQIYATLLLQTNYRQPAPALHCRLDSRQSQPRLSTGVLGRGRVGLILPRTGWRELRQSELEILLATGLARCASVSRRLVLLLRLIFTASLLIMLAVLPFTGVDRRALWIFAGASACSVVSGGMLVWQQRVLAFRGDVLAVQWLGRARVCQGLHLLAHHGQPSRRLAWGEPSLNARIARVCGTSITPKDKHLTLVG